MTRIAGRLLERVTMSGNEGRRFGLQVSWAFGSRATAAVLQVATLALLARGLTPARFAFVTSVYVVLQAVVAVNGLGLQRDIQLRRSRSPDDPELPSLFALRLRFTYASAALWLVTWTTIALVTQQSLHWAMVPAAVWLVAEQTTAVWNGISIVDGRSQHLLASYLWRRGPVVLALAVGLGLHWSLAWTWSISLALGAMLAYVTGARTQEKWALRLWPGRSSVSTRLNLDLGYWWCQVGDQLRDLDVAVLALVAAHTGGVYAFPARFVRPMNLLTQATGAVAFPSMVRRKSFNGREMGLALVVALLPVVCVAAVTAAAAPLIPVVIGQKYADSVQAMQILCLAACLFGASTLFAFFLQARDSRATRAAGLAHLFAAILQISLVSGGGWRFGVAGAAWGAVLSQLVLVTVLALRSKRQIREEAPATSPVPPGTVLGSRGELVEAEFVEAGATTRVVPGEPGLREGERCP